MKTNENVMKEADSNGVMLYWNINVSENRRSNQYYTVMNILSINVKKLNSNENEMTQ